MASADFCIARIASSLTPLALSDGQCRPPGIRHTSFIWRDMDLLLLLRLGIGLCFVWQTYPHKSLISIFCSCPPNFVLDFLHPHPHGHKLVFDYLIPPNWLTGDLHSRCCVMSCVPMKGRGVNIPAFPFIRISKSISLLGLAVVLLFVLLRLFLRLDEVLAGLAHRIGGVGRD